MPLTAGPCEPPPMSRIAWVVLLAAASAAACDNPGGLPVTTPPPPVVGHWLLENVATQEYLWIELDGTFTESGVPALSDGLSAGSWTFVSPDGLTLDDARSGPRAFVVAVLQGGGELLMQTL